MDNQKLLSKLNSRTRFTQFLVWLALFFTAAGIAAGYKNWLRIHEKAKTSLAGVAQLKSEIPELAKKKQLELLTAKVEVLSKEGKEHLDGALKELRNIQDSTQHIADTVYTQVEGLTLQQEVGVKTQAPSNQDWSIAEIHFLLLSASQTLQLKHNKEGAITALNLADQLLVKKGSTNLLPLRKQISTDIALLKQYKQPNITALSEKVDLLLEQLKPKVVKQEKKATKVIDTDEVQKTKSDKKEETESLVSRVKKTLTEAVVVRKFDRTLQEEMDELSKESLYQLLSLRLETLRLMLLQARDENYHKQLARIKTLIKSYYPEKDYKNLEKHLDELNAVDLTPKVPNVSGSLKMLESMMPNLSKGK